MNNIGRNTKPQLTIEMQTVSSSTPSEATPTLFGGVAGPKDTNLKIPKVSLHDDMCTLRTKLLEHLMTPSFTYVGNAKARIAILKYIRNVDIFVKEHGFHFLEAQNMIKDIHNTTREYLDDSIKGSPLTPHKTDIMTLFNRIAQVD
jgi:hypothetical protein